MSIGRIHSIKIEWKQQDMWIGVFWKDTFIRDIWICLLPCLPIHIRWIPKDAPLKFTPDTEVQHGR